MSEIENQNPREKLQEKAKENGLNLSCIKCYGKYWFFVKDRKGNVLNDEGISNALQTTLFHRR